MHITSKRYFFSCSCIAVGAALFFSLAPTASADVNGTLIIGPCTTGPGLGGVVVTLSTITWAPNGSVAGTGCFQTQGGTDVTYSGGTITSGTGNIANLPGGPASFITLNSLDFVLDGFQAPTPTNGTDCAHATLGKSCIVASGSPFLVTNDGTLTNITLLAFGTVVDGGVTSTWTGLFENSLNLTPGAIQSAITGAPGSITSGYTAAIAITAVPEPVSLGMIGAGLVAFAFAGKKRKVRP